MAGYVGSSVERRGKNAEEGAAWSMAELQALLDEWIVAVWQNRPHDGLRDPLAPGRALTPNERYAALIDVAGYVPVPLSPEDYIELLPASWRVINSYGVKIGLRTYDSGELNPYRRQHSGIDAQNGRWEVRYDPYDISRIWIRNHHHGGWLSATWKHLRTAPVPFGEQAWNHARQLLAARGSDPATEAEIAAAAADLLDRAGQGPEPDAREASPQQDQAADRTRSPRSRRVAGTHRGHRCPAVAPPGTADGDEDSAGQADGRAEQAAETEDHAGAGDPAAVVRRAQGGREMVVADAGLLENRRAPATTLEGWRSFISADPSELALLPAGQWEALGERDRRDYDEARIAHHAELVVVTTSAIAEITSEGQLLVLMNQREIGARRGLIVSGDAATGKTTSIKQLGRLHELRVRARFPAGADRIPVVYVTCPPKGSPRKLAMEFARFLGLPLRTRANVTDIADAVCQVLIDARTDLVLVDEIHNLNHGTPAGEDLSDHLKYFTEHLPATFIYAGIDVERCGVFTGTRGRQLAGRCELICTGAFPYRDEWAQLIAALEATLRLHRHEPGTLPAQARYLHQRTGGMIGSLTHLIRGAAIRAILGGQEAITRPLLDSVRIDHAAESATRRASSTR